MAQRIMKGPTTLSNNIQVINGTIQNGDTQSFLFPSAVQQAVPIVSSFWLQYNDGEDHNVKNVNVNLNATVSGETVDLTCTALMQDNNNHQAPGNIGFQLMAFLS